MSRDDGGGSSRSQGLRPRAGSSPGPAGGHAECQLECSWLQLHAGLGVSVDLRLWVEKLRVRSAEGRVGTRGKTLRGSRGRWAGVCEVVQLGPCPGVHFAAGGS